MLISSDLDVDRAKECTRARVSRWEQFFLGAFDFQRCHVKAIDKSCGRRTCKWSLHSILFKNINLNAAVAEIEFHVLSAT